MINIDDKCCGCTACANVCPLKCISMQMNEEGFIFPIVDNTICIKCGKCERTCPVINKKNIQKNSGLNGFIFQNNDSDVLRESTSGGFFTALASYVIDNNGIVFGASYDDSFYIRHTYVEDKDGLKAFRNSKYTQSDPQSTFNKCKEYLELGRTVLYSGTPCQIAGLYIFLGKRYDNLITVDVVCRGVPSPGMFKKYIEWNGGADRISSIKFRKKYKGYYNGFMEIIYKNGKKLYREKHSDPMLSLFFKDICSRKSCYSCDFKTLERVSDFTMFDCWHAFRFDRSFGDGGATAVIARNERALSILKVLSKDNKCIEYDFSKMVEADGVMMTKNAPLNPKRDEFFRDLNCLTFNDVLDKYNKHSTLRVIELKIKTLLMRTGIFGKIHQIRMR